MKIQVSILAAGNSSRLGQPKQLLSWQKKPLIQYVAEEALKVQLPGVTTQVTIITGAYAEPVTQAVQQLPLVVLHNPDWQEGMASSVRMASHYAIETQADALLFLLTDQPYVTDHLIEQLIVKHLDYTHTDGIVVSDYGSEWGVPLLIGSAHFKPLLQLKGDSGVKPYIKQQQLVMQKVSFLKGLIDIDTDQDILYLQDKP